jgi:hypothetical protein
MSLCIPMFITVLYSVTSQNGDRYAPKGIDRFKLNIVKIAITLSVFQSFHPLSAVGE